MSWTPLDDPRDGTVVQDHVSRVTRGVGQRGDIMKEEPTPDATLGPSKKPYAKPRLIEYGPVEKLTHTGTQTLGDAGPMMMACL